MAGNIGGTPAISSGQQPECSVYLTRRQCKLHFTLCQADCWRSETGPGREYGQSGLSRSPGAHRSARRPVPRSVTLAGSDLEQGPDIPGSSALPAVEPPAGQTDCWTEPADDLDKGPGRCPQMTIPD